MEKKPLLKRILAVSLAAAVTVNGLTFSALAEDNGAIAFKEVSNNSVSAGLLGEKLDTDSGESPYEDSDVVRVSIVLKDKSTIENTVDLGYDIEDIAENYAAMSYRSDLQNKQTNVVNEIERVIDSDLDVVWNLTLAANIISANVEYGQIEAIESLDDVQEVLIETQYYPDVLKETLALDPNMATSSEQIGSGLAWANWYTGAGSRIAVIDTGTDDDHQSFSEAGFLHSLELLADEKGSEYVENLNLLTWDEINSVKDQLNAGTAYNNQSQVAPITSAVYLNAKLPFAYNYVDSDYDINHDNDTQGEHGSHVAGIATANKYIQLADGSFVKALDYSMANTQGVAPDAQLITMKVFGKNGGAYDSDYMVAIEDAIVLKADSINLSLGSGNPGASKSSTEKYQKIFDNLAKSGVVVSISSGNAGYWAENAVSPSPNSQRVPYLYADDVSMQTDGAPGSFTNALTVASVDNVGNTGAYIQVGDEKIFYNESPDYDDETGKGYKSLMSIAGDHDYVFTDGFGSKEEWAALGDALKGKVAVCSRGNKVNFTDKANWAIEAGAIATIIYNNEAGTFGMVSDGYKYSAPYVSITKEAGQILKAYAVENGTAIVPADPEPEPEPGTDTNTAEADETVNEAENAETTETDNDNIEETKAPEGTEAADASNETATTEVSAEEAAPAADTAPAGYIASLKVSGDSTVVYPEAPVNQYQTMSSFSSWGVPGTLQLKPEITAPGGNIYSVNGAIDGGEAYENMSGTSMAAPQIAGMSALAAQYVREEGLAEKTGLTPRVLIQSLLMSTATPLKNSTYESTYPVIQQGAGLANINDVISAESYILMDENANSGAKDGKVKVELGDDPDMKGEYTFGFTVNNLTAAAKEYTLSTELFTQAFTSDNNDTIYMHTSTFDLARYGFYSEEYTVNGAKTNTVTVPANGSVQVNVKITLDVETMKAMGLLDIFENGLYIEGYTYVTGVSDAEGAKGTVHSIPILGFLGNWTDPSMFDVGTYTEFVKGEEGRLPYVNLTPVENVFGIEYSDEPGSAYPIDGANPIILDETYMPERSAINGSDLISFVQFTAIRNAANSRLAIINESSPEKSVAMEAGAVNAAYYHTNQGRWMGTTASLNIGTTLSSLGFKQGDKATLQFTLAPEYYVDDSGEEVVTDWDKLGKGASFDVSLTVDNTKPEIVRISLEEDGTVLRVAARDNQYVAGVVLYNKTGDVVVSQIGSNPDAEPSELGAFKLPLDGVKGTEFLVQVYDYAKNASTYKFSEEIGEDIPAPYALALNYNSRNDSTSWISLNHTEGQFTGFSSYAGCPANFVAAANADHYIFAIDENGTLYVMSEDDVYSYVKVANLDVAIDDMAYNALDGQLYGVVKNNDEVSFLVTIDKLTGEIEAVAAIPYTTALACDNDGIFYASYNGTTYLYAFTLDNIEGAALVYDISKYEVGIIDGVQGLEVDPNTNKLYWFANTVDGEGQAADYYSSLFILDFVNSTEEAYGLNNEYFGVVFTDGRTKDEYDYNDDGDVNELDGQALLDYRTGVKEIANVESKIIDVDNDGDFDTHDAYVLLNSVLWARPTDEVHSVTISDSTAVMVTNGYYQLEANVTPWTASNRDVTWSSSDTSVAEVDANGLVTAKKAGTCTITAAAKGDTNVSVSCEVTVENVEVTLYGALQDEDGNPTFYDWNVEEGDTWTRTIDIERLGGDICAAAVDHNGFVYISDSQGAIHKIDPSNGLKLDSADAGGALNDMAYSYIESTEDTPLFTSVSGYLLFAPTAYDSYMTAGGWNLSSLLNEYGASKFVAITSAGGIQLRIDAETVVVAEEYLAIDDVGNIYDFAMVNGQQLYTIDIYTSVMPAGFLGTNNDGEYCSLELGTDGYLYLAAFDGNTSNLYRITMTEDFIGASYFGNVGDGVWPATILTATGNAAAAAAYADEVKEVNGKLSADITEFSELSEAETEMSETVSETDDEFTVNKIGEKTNVVFNVSDNAALEAYAIDGYGIATMADEAGEEGSDTASSAVISGSTIDIELKTQNNHNPEESTNGLFLVKYSPEAMEFTGVESVNGVYNSYNEEDGVLVIAFASALYSVPEDQPDQVANFKVLDEELAKTAPIEVVQLELNQENNYVVNRVAPVVVKISSIAEDVETIVAERPELAEELNVVEAPDEPGPDEPDPGTSDTEPSIPVPSLPTLPSGSFTVPSATTAADETTVPTEAPAETTAPADNNGVASGDNSGTDNTNGGSTSDNGNGGASTDTTAPVDNNGGNGTSGDNGANSTDNTDNSGTNGGGSDSNVGNTDNGAAAGDDKNQNTGVALFVAPAAISALAVLVSKKKFKK